jgi:hypothetical protein
MYSEALKVNFFFLSLYLFAISNIHSLLEQVGLKEWIQEPLTLDMLLKM